MAENEVKYQVRISDEYVNSDMENASKSLEKSGGKLANVGKSMGSAVGVGLAAAGTAAIAIGTQAITSANDIDKAMNGFIASTGKGVSETKRYQDILGNIYKNNYGESFEDIAGSMALVNQQMGNLSDEQLQKTTEHAYLLSDTFDIDINEGLRGVNSMMKQFGITSEEAYNLIAQGAQNGLNQNGDLADQLSEYSVYYGNMGFSAEETMNIIAAGAKDGAFQIDYLNDAVKEFGIRSKDSSKGTTDAFTALGLDAENMTKKFAEGGAGAKTAFEEVTTALANVSDKAQQDAIGVQLFGTKWEDLGVDAVLAMTNAGSAIDINKDKLDEMSEIKYNSLGDLFEGMKRSLELLLIPLGEMLIPLLTQIINEILPVIEELLPPLIETIGELLPPIMDLAMAVMPVLVDLIKMLLPPLMDLMSSIMPVLIEVFNAFLPPLMELLEVLLPPLIELFGMIAPILQALMPVIKMLAKSFSGVLGTAIELVMPIIQGIMPILQGIIDFITGVFSGNWEKAWDGIVSIFKGIVNLIPAIFEGIINGAIGLINGLINGVNGLTENIGLPPIPNIPTITIPRFKAGIDFVPNDKMLSYLDYGERVLTQGQNEQFNSLGGLAGMQLALSKGIQNSVVGNTEPIYNIQGEQQSDSPKQPLIVYVQARNHTIGKVAIDDINEITRANGKNPLKC